MGSGFNVAERYTRQVKLPEIGAAGQEKLSRSTVLVVGCGALGSVQMEHLARAGVGRLVIADRDIIEIHNLHRQLLYDEEDVALRLPKAEAAGRHLGRINSGIEIVPLIEDVSGENVLGLVRGADLVMDATDNFETRYLINDACVKEGKPWVYGGVVGTVGNVMAVRPGRGPCLRCVFPDPPEPGTLRTADTAGVLNTAVAWVASLQVTEAYRILIGDTEAGFRLHSLDVWRPNLSSVQAARAGDCPCCGRREFIFLDAAIGLRPAVLKGRNAVQVTPPSPFSPDFSALKKRLEPLGSVKFNGIILEFATGGIRLVVFPDGRVLVVGTTDPAEAKDAVARYLGF